MEKERNLEEFRSFRTSKRREKRKKQRSDEREDVKNQNFFVVEKISNEKQSN